MSREADSADIYHCNGSRSAAGGHIILVGHSGNFFQPPVCLGETCPPGSFIILIFNRFKAHINKIPGNKVRKTWCCVAPAMVENFTRSGDYNANCQMLIVSRLTSERSRWDDGDIFLLSPHLCCRRVNVQRQGRSSESSGCSGHRTMSFINPLFMDHYDHQSGTISKFQRLWGHQRGWPFFLFAEMGMGMCDIYL